MIPDTSGILAGIVEEVKKEASENTQANSDVLVEKKAEEQTSVAVEQSAVAEKLITDIVKETGFSNGTLPETMTEEEMRKLIEVANRHNPKNILSKDTVPREIWIMESNNFTPPAAVTLGTGDGNRAYASLMSKKIREAMADKRVMDLLRHTTKPGVKYPAHTYTTANLMMALAVIARTIHVHGTEYETGAVIRWVGGKCRRDIDPGNCTMVAVVENLQPLFQMSSYWLPAQGLTPRELQYLGLKPIMQEAPVVEEQSKTQEEPVQVETTA